MSGMTFLLWLQNLDLFSWIRGSSDAYLLILSVHLAALALFGGMVLMTDLRLLGVSMRGYSVSEVVNGLRIPKRIGFSLAVVSGVLLFGSNAGQNSQNPWFWTKMALLALLGVNYRVFRRAYVAEREKAPGSGGARAAAVVSLLLWTGVICAGRGPATIKDVMHSIIDPNGDFVFQSVEQISDEHGVHEKAPQTDADWDEVLQHLAVLQEAPSLLAGRKAARPRDRSRNPESESEPEQIEKAVDADRPALMRRARRLQDAARDALRAADAKDKDGLLRSIDRIDKACENCHLHYWYPNDKRAQEAAKADGIEDY